MNVPAKVLHLTRSCVLRLRCPVSSPVINGFPSLLFSPKAFFQKKAKTRVYVVNDTFERRESIFYHSVLQGNPRYSKSILKKDYFTTLLDSVPPVDVSLDDDLSNLTSETAVPIFAAVTRDIVAKKVDVLSVNLEPLATFIKRNVKYLQMDDVMTILSLLYLWPVAHKLYYPDIKAIIYSLDAACVSKVPNLKTGCIEDSLLFIERWHWLGLCSVSEFAQMATGKLLWRAETTEHLVQLLFYMSELRALPNHYDTPAIEKKLVKHLKYFNADEFGILAAGFYKTKTKVTNYVFYKQIVRKITKDLLKFNDICLNATLKLLRSTVRTFNGIDDVKTIHKTILPHLSTLSALCLVQVAMLGTPLEVIDKDLMVIVLKKLSEHLHDLREKDLQRVMYVCAMAMKRDDVSEFVSQVLEEIRRRDLTNLHKLPDFNTNPEVRKKMVSFVEMVLFLDILGYRSIELVESALTGGILLKILPRETVALQHLDAIVDIIFPNFNGPRLEEDQKKAYYQFWFPGRSLKYPAMHWYSFEWRDVTSEMMRQFYLDACNACGGNNNVGCFAVLPFYEHKDLIVCLDQNGNFVPFPRDFGTGPLWSTIVPPKSEDNDRKFCILMLLRDRSKDGLPDYTLYQSHRKELLQKLGYRIATVRYKIFDMIRKEEKNAYLLQVIREAE